MASGDHSIPDGHIFPAKGVYSLPFAMLERGDISKRFAGIAAVDNVSFSAHAGKITGYLGRRVRGNPPAWGSRIHKRSDS